MATGFATIIREVAKHANAYASGSASTVQTDYTIATPTITQVVDPYFSLDFIKDKIVDAHSRLALEIANVRAHPWRAQIGNTQTATLAHGAALPLTASSKTIIGAWGQVLAGGVPCSEAAPERVRAAAVHSIADPPLYTNPYLYYIDGNRIYHTETTVTINCCTYERADIVTLIGTTPPGSITLPDVLVDAIVAGAVTALIVEAKGMEQGSYFKNYFEGAIESIRKGLTAIPMMTLKATA